MKLYGLGIHLRETFTSMTDKVKHNDYMDFKDAKHSRSN